MDAGAAQGLSVSLSADGNTAIVGGPNDNGGGYGAVGAAWVWTRTGGVWTEQGTKLVGSGAEGWAGGFGGQGSSVSLSSDGNTAIVGGQFDNQKSWGGAAIGAAWVWTRSNGVWTQQGTKLVGSGVDTTWGARQGYSVSLSADGNTAIVGGPAYVASSGAAWIWTRNEGVWTQQGTMGGGFRTSVASSVSLAGDGNTAIASSTEGAWVSTRSGGVWTSQENVLNGSGTIGIGSVSLSADGKTAIGGNAGAWAFTLSALPAVPPIITTQPANQVVTVGASTTFAVAASGTPVPTFQWQVSTNGGSTFSNLSNAAPYSRVTTAVLTITAVPNSANGARYRVVASNSAGSATSAAAALAVTGIGGVLFSQQGPKLVGTGAVGPYGDQGTSVSLSAGGDMAIVGGGGGGGAVWAWTRNGGVWTQQGPKLVGSGAVGNAYQGCSASLSAEGDTAIVGGYGDNNQTGAAWIWTRSAGIWTQQGAKLVGSVAVGSFAAQGYSVSLSADGNTAIVGGYNDIGAGASWVWTRDGGVWTQQGMKLVGSGAGGNAWQGWSVSLSADGNTAIVGGYNDNNGAGAAWTWTRSGGVWTQQGTKLVGSGAVGNAHQGSSVSISADGNTAIVGGVGDNNLAGSAWVWARSGGVWTQQGTKLTGSGAGRNAWQGGSVSLSADGNKAIVGGYNDYNDAGAAWVWTRSGGVWTQQGTKLVGTGAVGGAQQGYSVSLSADGTTAIIGGPNDNNDNNRNDGAAWVFYSSAPTFIPAAITTQPMNQAVAVGANTAFTVTAGGTPVPALQWQVSTDGGTTYANLSNAVPYGGVTTATLTITAAPSSLNGTRYRAVAINSAGSATSAAAVLTVTGIAPTITSSTTGNSLTLRWPDSATGYRVQSALSLSALISWNNVSGTFQTNGGFISLVLPISGGQKFYRLVKP